MLTRGEVQLVEPSSHPSRRKHIQLSQVSRSHSPSMAHEEIHEHVPAEDEDLRKDVMEMRELMKILMERNAGLQFEGSNPSKNKGDSGDKTPNGNGGNGASPPPSPPYSYYSSTNSRPLLNSPRRHGKTPSQIPSLKLDINLNCQYTMEKLMLRN
jgi:hypothetical protein